MRKTGGRRGWNIQPPLRGWMCSDTEEDPFKLVSSLPAGRGNEPVLSGQGVRIPHFSHGKNKRILFSTKSGISSILGSPFNLTLRRPRWKLKRIEAAAPDRQMFSVNKKRRCQFDRPSRIIQLLTPLYLFTLVVEELLHQFSYLITWCDLSIFMSKDGKICRNRNMKILLYQDYVWNNV